MVRSRALLSLSIVQRARRNGKSGSQVSDRQAPSMVMNHSRFSFQAHELDQKIQDLYKRIQTERSYIAASEKVRRATSNQEVLRRNDAQIRESQRSLSYFEETLRDLQARKAQVLRAPQQQPRATEDQAGGSGGFPSTLRPGGSSDRDRALPLPPSTSPEDYGASQYDGYGPPPPEAPRPKQYSNLGKHTSLHTPCSIPKCVVYQSIDLIKAETPYTTAKISRMLEQLQFKLQVENQYKKAIIQMTKLYQADGDKKSRADADAKRVESDKKIQLLQAALKRYRNLHIIDDPQVDDGKYSRTYLDVAHVRVTYSIRSTARRRRPQGQPSQAFVREALYHRAGSPRFRPCTPPETLI